MLRVLFGYLYDTAPVPSDSDFQRHFLVRGAAVVKVPQTNTQMYEDFAIHGVTRKEESSTGFIGGRGDVRRSSRQPAVRCDRYTIDQWSERLKESGLIHCVSTEFPGTHTECYQT